MQPGTTNGAPRPLPGSAHACARQIRTQHRSGRHRVCAGIVVGIAALPALDIADAAINRGLENRRPGGSSRWMAIVKHH